jgi:dTDP-4-dehydrorhamnose 3,5-epimerase
MIFVETKLAGAWILDIERRGDERGFFARTYCWWEFEQHGLLPRIVQANVSFNRRKGTLRGMHYQAAPFAEAKLVRCSQGALYDVIIDLRPESATFKQWIGVELTAENHRMLFVPEGFAHGFITLTDNAEVVYQVSQFYTPGAERGVRWNDPAFGITWPGAVTTISDRDSHWPDFVAELAPGVAA